MKKLNLFIVLLAFVFVSFVVILPENTINKLQKSELLTFKVETVVGNLDVPWSMTFLPDNSMLITLKKGQLIHFKDGKKFKITNLPKIQQKGQGGLLDIELDPAYEENGWIYLSFSGDTEGNSKGVNTTIIRAKLSGNKLTSKEVLYKATPNSNRGQHFGSRLEFDQEGHLFFSVGDRGNRDKNPQDISRDGGKIYRINSDGSIPEDNPFVNVKKAKKAIYSYGHRNPQGMTIHPETGKIWTHEHGPKGGDEINIIEPGKNYGWPTVTYGVNYNSTKITNETSRANMNEPFHYWVPSIAPCGMDFVTSEKYPDWYGNLLVGSLKFRYLNRCVIENGEIVKEEKLLEGLGRVRCVRQAPDGYIYVALENKGIVKLVPN
jgi:glucose/arabinose dehydrogenase